MALLNPKRKILFLCPYPVGVAPSQRFRFEQYFNLLELNNFYFRVHPFLNQSAWTILYQRGRIFPKVLSLLQGFIRRLFVVAFIAPQFDYVFIHREAAPLGPPIFEWLLARVWRKKVIYDFDDAIWLANTSEENKVAARLKMHSKVGVICRWSYGISAGNDYLCDYARQFNSNVILNPTTVDTQHQHNAALYERRQESDTIIIGWTGSHSTLKYLNLLEPVLQNLLRSGMPIQFLVLADKKPELAFDFIFIPWSEETEVRELAHADIGVMPLDNDLWAKGKCGFKAIQYLALSIPALASPVGVNSKIIDDGINGYLCSTLKDWEMRLAELIQNPTLRKKMGEAGRKKIEEHYSLEANSSNFLSLFP